MESHFRLTTQNHVGPNARLDKGEVARLVRA